jgi:hypothetical protein
VICLDPNRSTIIGKEAIPDHAGRKALTPPDAMASVGG